MAQFSDWKEIAKCRITSFSLKNKKNVREFKINSASDLAKATDYYGSQEFSSNTSSGKYEVQRVGKSGWQTVRQFRN